MRNRICGFIVGVCGVSLVSCGGSVPVEDQASIDSMAITDSAGVVEESPMVASESDPAVSTEGKLIATAEEPPEAETSDEKSLIGPIEEREIFCAFELNGETVGYARIVLAKSDETDTFQYLHEMTIDQPNGVRITGKATAALNDLFVPSEAVLNRVVTLPDGEQQSQSSRLVLHDDHMVLSVDENGQLSEQQLPHPGVPVVFGVECLLETIDLPANPTFSLNELNPQDGTVQQLNFSVEAVEAGFDITATVAESGATSEDAYTTDGEGMFTGMRMTTAPVQERRITEAEYNALKVSLDS